jgi:hypothetical protein
MQFSSAMTKSYQNKMRQWHRLQNSDFFINYRRQSNKTNRIALPCSTTNESNYRLVSNQQDKSSCQHVRSLLSSHQRSSIVHQWYELINEELSLRHDQDYLNDKLQHLKQLESHLKGLKRRIFAEHMNVEQSTRYRSMTNVQRTKIQSNDGHRAGLHAQRCHSLESFVVMPTSWLFTVQNAAYSDILDGTSTTDRTKTLTMHFFEQLNQLKHEREQFEKRLIDELHTMTHVK